MAWASIKESEEHLLGEEGDESPARRRPWTRPRMSWLVVGASIALIVVILFTTSLAIIHIHPPSSNQHDPNIRSCGQSASEARALGCTYDIMMDSWLPPDCYDEELSLEFQALRDWAFYAHKNGTHRMTIQELSEREHTFAHTTIEYHYIHCLFSWRKLHRAMEYGFDIEREVGELGHTNHCTGFVAHLGHRLEDPDDLPSLQKIGTKLPVAFPTCVSISDVVKER